MDISLVGNKRHKKKKEKAFLSMKISIVKPGGNKYTEIDFEDYKRENLDVQDDSSGDDRFHDKHAMEIARRLEAKYAKKGKKKQMRFHEENFIDKSAGYDLEDGFIDDSEAFEEELPSTMETIKGGFYVNKGTLELRQLDEDELENAERMELDIELQKLKKRKNVGIEQSGSDSDCREVNKKESKKANGTAEKEKVKDDAPVLARMTGAPPTKRALNDQEKNLEIAKRRKLVGNLISKKVVSNNDPGEKEKHLPQKEQKRTTPPPAVTSTVASSSTATASSSHQPVATSSNSIIVLDEEPIKSSPAPIPVPKPAQTHPKNVQNAMPKITIQQALAKTLPSVKPFAENDSNAINDQILSMINMQYMKTANANKQNVAVSPSVSPKKNKIEAYCMEIKVLAEDLKKKGKKRLSDELVDAFIKLENQMMSEKIKAHEQSRIFTHLADLVSNSVATIKGRMATRKIDLEISKKKETEVSSSDASSTKSNVQGTIFFKMGDVKKWTVLDLQVVNGFLDTSRRTSIVTDEMVRSVIETANNVRLNGAMTVALLSKQIEDNNKFLLSISDSKPRKARVYLANWVQQSQSYWKTMCSKPRSKGPDEAQLLTARGDFTELTKTVMKKFIENKMMQQNVSQNNTITFEYTEKFIGGLNTFMDLIFDAAVSKRNKDIIYSALNTTYLQMKDVLISKPLFFIEVCRRLPKITLVLNEEPVKSEMARADLSTDKYQVVQNAKYALKWPEGINPQESNSNGPLISKPPTSLVSPQFAPKGVTMMLPKTAQRTSLPASNSTSSLPSSSSSSNLKKGTSGDDDIQVLPSTSKAVSSTVQMPSAQAQTAIAQTLSLLNHPGLPMVQRQALLLQLASNKDFNNLLEVQKKKDSDEKKKKELEEKRRKEMEDKKRKEDEERAKRLKEEEDRKKKELQRKAEEERNRLEKERIMKEMQKKLEEERARKEAEKERNRLAELERKRQKEEEKNRLKEEERLRKEKEVREAKERQRRAEEAKKAEEERLHREMEAIRKKKEAEEIAKKEKERQWRLEKEAADALQDLEQDNMMDDLEFLSEQQEKDDQQKQEAEKIRAEERAKQIETLRARKLAADEQRMKELKPVITSAAHGTISSSNVEPIPPIANIKQEPLSQEIDEKVTHNFSSSSNGNPTNGGSAPGLIKQQSNTMANFDGFDKPTQQFAQQYGGMNTMNQMNYGISTSNQVSNQSNQMVNSISSNSMMLSHTPISQYQQGLATSTSSNYNPHNVMMGIPSMANQQVTMDMRQMNNYGQIPQNTGMMGMGFGNMMPQQSQQVRAQQSQLMNQQMQNQQQQAAQQEINQRLLRQQQNEWINQQQKQNMFSNQMNGNFNGYR